MDEDEDEDVLVIDGGTDESPLPSTPHTKDSKSTSRAASASGQPPARETFLRGEYTTAEIIDAASEFQQKARESIRERLVRLRDGAGRGNEHYPPHTHTPCPPAAPAWRRGF